MQVIGALLRYSRLLILAGLMVALTFASPVFLTSSNLMNVVRQTALLAILGFAMTLAILTGGIDLSIGSSLALSSCLAAPLLKEMPSMLPGILLCLLVSTTVGLINGVIVAKVKLPPFIATYGMNWVTRGLTVVYMGGNIVYGFPKSFRFFGAGHVRGIPTPIVAMAVVFALLYILLRRTTLGRNIYAVGASKEATYLSGVDTDRVIVSVYALNGLLVGVAAMLYISRLNAAEASIGESFPLEAIAATLVGGTPFTGGEGGISNTLVGALILTLLANGMNLLGVSSLSQSAVFGGIIIFAIMLEQLSKRLAVANA